MASKFARGKFVMKHPEKYVGNKVPTYRSSWEWSFMNFCDNNKSVQKWASEAIQIPYRDPLTGRQTVYVPDFFIQYVDKNSKMIVELIEIKPSSQQIIERVGKNKYNQAQTQFIKVETRDWKSLELPSHIDYLQLDTEGSELAILDCVDWSTQHISYICLEDNAVEYGDKTYYNYTLNLGYHCILHQGVDFLWYKE